MKCPHCNQEHPEGFFFCPITGQKLDQLKACANPECPNYGKHILPIESRFCPWCGMILNGANRTEISQESRMQKEPDKNVSYDSIDSFHDGLACVRRNGKYGYIDKHGTEVIECQYDNADDFSEGLAYVNYDEKKRFIDKQGNVVFLLDDSLELYGLNTGFHDGLCKVGNKIDDDHDDYAKIGFINKTGNLVIDCQFDGASNFHNGRALVWDAGDEDDYEYREVNFRFIDVDGFEVIGSYDNALEFRNGYAAIQIDTLPKRIGNYKTRIIDVNGKTVHKIDTHDRLRSYRDNNFGYNYGLHDKVFLYSYRKWIDIETGTKHEINWDEGLDITQNGFSEGMAAVKDKQGKWGFMNVNGDVVIRCQFENDYAPSFSEGLAVVKQNGKYGFVDKTGKVVIPYQYTEAGGFSEGRAVVRKTDVLMVIDNKGNRIV